MGCPVGVALQHRQYIQPALQQHQSVVRLSRQGEGGRGWKRAGVGGGRSELGPQGEQWQLQPDQSHSPHMSWEAQHWPPWFCARSNVGTEPQRPVSAAEVLLGAREGILPSFKKTQWQPQRPLDAAVAFLAALLPWELPDTGSGS